MAAKSSSASSPLEITKLFLKAMEPLDYDNALMLVAETCEYTNPPPIGTVHGPAGIRAVLEPFFSPTLENEFRILREAASGPVVVLERLDRHRLADKWGRIARDRGVRSSWRPHHLLARLFRRGDDPVAVACRIRRERCEHRRFTSSGSRSPAIVVGSFGPVFFLGTMAFTQEPARFTLDLLSWPLDGATTWDSPDTRFLSALTGGFLFGLGRYDLVPFGMGPRMPRRKACAARC